MGIFRFKLVFFCVEGEPDAKEVTGFAVQPNRTFQFQFFYFADLKPKHALYFYVVERASPKRRSAGCSTVPLPGTGTVEHQFIPYDSASIGAACCPFALIGLRGGVFYLSFHILFFVDNSFWNY